MKKLIYTATLIFVTTNLWALAPQTQIPIIARVHNSDPDYFSDISCLSLKSEEDYIKKKKKKGFLHKHKSQIKLSINSDSESDIEDITSYKKYERKKRKDALQKIKNLSIESPTVTLSKYGSITKEDIERFKKLMQDEIALPPIAKIEIPRERTPITDTNSSSSYLGILDLLQETSSSSSSSSQYDYAWFKMPDEFFDINRRVIAGYTPNIKLKDLTVFETFPDEKMKDWSFEIKKDINTPAKIDRKNKKIILNYYFLDKRYFHFISFCIIHEINRVMGEDIRGEVNLLYLDLKSYKETFKNFSQLKHEYWKLLGDGLIEFPISNGMFDFTDVINKYGTQSFNETASRYIELEKQA